MKDSLEIWPSESRSLGCQKPKIFRIPKTVVPSLPCYFRKGNRRIYWSEEASVSSVCYRLLAVQPIKKRFNFLNFWNAFWLVNLNHMYTMSINRISSGIPSPVLHEILCNRRPPNSPHCSSSSSTARDVRSTLFPTWIIVSMRCSPIRSPFSVSSTFLCCAIRFGCDRSCTWTRTSWKWLF